MFFRELTSNSRNRVHQRHLYSLPLNSTKRHKMEGKRKSGPASGAKANLKYFESPDVLRALDDVREWLQKNSATKKVSHWLSDEQ